MRLHHSAPGGSHVSPQDCHILGHRTIERPQPTSQRDESARDIWVDILADIIIAEVLHEQESKTPR